MPTATEIAIATTTLGAGINTITFSSIPATYTDLRLVVTYAPYFTTAIGIDFQFNNDTATNYSSTRLRGDGASATSARQSSVSTISTVVTTPQSVYSMATLDVFSYAGSTYKTALSTLSADANGSGSTVSLVGLWRSTSAINRIDVLATGTNFISGTTATLYGIL